MGEVTSETAIQLLRTPAHNERHSRRMELIMEYAYLRFMPMPSSDVPYVLHNARNLSQPEVPRHLFEAPPNGLYAQITNDSLQFEFKIQCLPTAHSRVCACVSVCVCVFVFDKCLVRMSCAKMWACATQNRQPAAPAADCRTMLATHSRCVRSQASSTQPHMHMAPLAPIGPICPHLLFQKVQKTL